MGIGNGYMTRHTVRYTSWELFHHSYPSKSIDLVGPRALGLPMVWQGGVCVTPGLPN